MAIGGAVGASKPFLGQLASPTHPRDSGGFYADMLDSSSGGVYGEPAMMSNPDQLELAEALRDEGQGVVLAGTPDAWQQNFRRSVERLARGGRTFTSEDIVADCGPPPTHHNAVGAMMAALSKQGLIQLVGYQKAHHTAGHARRIGIWRQRD